MYFISVNNFSDILHKDAIQTGTETHSRYLVQKNNDVVDSSAPCRWRLERRCSCSYLGVKFRGPKCAYLGSEI